MNDVYVIFIAPFDLFGQDKYMYTFQMTCQEIPGLVLNDGAAVSYTHLTLPTNSLV